MKITAIDTRPHPVCFVHAKDCAPKFYRSVLPARMVGASVHSEILIGRDGEQLKPVKLFEPGALDEFLSSELLIVAGMGSPSLIAWREFPNHPTLATFIHALLASGHDVRFDARVRAQAIAHPILSMFLPAMSSASRMRKEQLPFRALKTGLESEVMLDP